MKTNIKNKNLALQCLCFYPLISSLFMLVYFIKNIQTLALPFWGVFVLKILEPILVFSTDKIENDIVGLIYFLIILMLLILPIINIFLNKLCILKIFCGLYILDATFLLAFVIVKATAISAVDIVYSAICFTEHIIFIILSIRFLAKAKS